MNGKLMTCIFWACVAAVWAADPVPPQNKVIYQPETKDEALEKIEKRRETRAKETEKVTEEIKARHEQQEEQEEKEAREMISDLNGVKPPSDLSEFKTVFHFPPQPQYYTGTCWSYSATSFYESEIFRITGKKIKLSEMWTPYHEFLEKARGYIRERGHSLVSSGSQSNALPRIWKQYGVVPASVYTGTVEPDGLHDHVPLVKELNAYLEYISENDLWNEEENMKHVQLIVDKYMGRPPETFDYEGKTLTPVTFLAQETGLNMDDYESLMSTLFFPFFTRAAYPFEDNWWHNEDYINVPLDLWMQTIQKSIDAGYSLVIGGDVSEPGKLGPADVAFIPSFDIPTDYIDQNSREYRIYNETTGDDHGIHLVGHTRVGDFDWYLIKDSGRSARHGAQKGYYFFREDFIKLKMLTITVHKEMLSSILPKLQEESQPE